MGIWLKSEIDMNYPRPRNSIFAGGGVIIRLDRIAKIQRVKSESKVVEVDGMTIVGEVADNLWEAYVAYLNNHYSE